jgi:hypothetical protein
MAQASAGKNDDKLFEINAYALSQLLLKNSILYCESSVLTRALDALTLTDTVLTVYERIEKEYSSTSSASSAKETAKLSTTTSGGVTSTTATTATTSGGTAANASTLVITIGDNVFSRDGLLMSEDSILSTLTQYCIQEMKRREVSYESHVLPDYHANKNKSSAASSAGIRQKSSSSSSGGSSGVDVESLISVLQKFENHLIAIQILFRSWTHSPMKLQVRSSTFLFPPLPYFYCLSLLVASLVADFLDKKDSHLSQHRYFFRHRLSVCAS